MADIGYKDNRSAHRHLRRIGFGRSGQLYRRRDLLHPSGTVLPDYLNGITDTGIFRPDQEGGVAGGEKTAGGSHPGEIIARRSQSGTSRCTQGQFWKTSKKEESGRKAAWSMTGSHWAAPHRLPEKIPEISKTARPEKSSVR